LAYIPSRTDALLF
jgi:hypothetical protein